MDDEKIKPGASLPQVIHRQGDPRAKDCQTNLHQIELSGGDDHQDGDGAGCGGDDED